MLLFFGGVLVGVAVGVLIIAVVSSNRDDDFWNTGRPA